MRRAHRSAYVLLVRPLAGTPEFRKAAFAWLEEAVFEHRGTGRINRELRREGLTWDFSDVLKAHYSTRRLEPLVYQESPFMALLAKRAA